MTVKREPTGCAIVLFFVEATLLLILIGSDQAHFSNVVEAEIEFIFIFF